ncbi:hypothetical protein ACHAQH_008844 [Verticillium albo-atrum]
MRALIWPRVLRLEVRAHLFQLGKTLSSRPVADGDEVTEDVAGAVDAFLTELFVWIDDFYEDEDEAD